MFPWLAFGHLIPSLELAKLIAQKGHHISFVSTPRNIECLPKLSPNLASFIKFMKLALPKVDNLPENVEATIDVPYDVVQYLKKAYDDLKEPLTCFLKSSKVDWHFYDLILFWADTLDSKIGIKSSFYNICTSPFLIGDDPVRAKIKDFIVPSSRISFSTIVAYRHFKMKRNFDVVSDNDSSIFDMYHFGVNCDIVVIKRCTEFKPKWFEMLENIYQKLVIPVDHGLNSRVLEVKKMGYSIPKNERDGSFTSDAVANLIRLVMVEEEGRIYMEKVKNVKDLCLNSVRQEKYINKLQHY
uniref:UDP-glycosyltransferase n=1 Tax=Glycine max TaxID=3847 RepID=A0A0R0ITL9_SOYBN